MNSDVPASLRYRDASLPVDERVSDLLAQMTLDEKLAQLGSVWVFQLADRSGFDVDRASKLLADGLGHVTRVGGASSLDATEAAHLANDVQRHLIEHTRLGVPTIIHEEICSGLMAREATAYPQAIGVAASFRPEHNRAMADTIRRQMRAVGAHHGLSPVLDICRDPRWGRLEETYGEDPYLVSLMGIEFVRGLQSDDLSRGVVATAKHFVGYGASEGGMNWAPAHLPERELRDVYLRPFEAVVREAEIASVMNGYHELDGVPCGANRWLLTDLLRGEWGFEGTVVSDYFAIKQLDEYHHVATDPSAAAAMALTAGIDVELPSTDCYADPLRGALATGAVRIDVLDEAVRRVLTSKFQLGLFEHPFVDLAAIDAVTRSDEQIDLATTIAEESLVLLRNDGTLPLAAGSSVAVIGPSGADGRNMLGDYSYLAHVESLIEVLKSGRNVFAMPLDHGADIDGEADLAHVTQVSVELAAQLAGGAVTYARGCGVLDEDRSGFDEAVAAAAAADVAVMVMGDRSGLTDECTSGESRDVASLDLPGVQEDLVLAVAATGTPVVLVIVAGRPIGSPEVQDACAAVMMAWLPGERGGDAIARALTGEFSPGGKLPVSYPRSVGQVPIFYGHKISGGRSHWKGAYVDLSNEPLYPFGHGLTYSTFTVAADSIDGTSVPAGGTIEIVARVTNTGGCVADEVVQVYSRQAIASITRPVLELQGFQRVTLQSGGSARVTFRVPVDGLGFTGRELAYMIEPGTIEFFVGTSATEHESVGSVRIEVDRPTERSRVTSNHAAVEHVRRDVSIDDL